MKLRKVRELLEDAFALILILSVVILPWVGYCAYLAFVAFPAMAIWTPWAVFHLVMGIVLFFLVLGWTIFMIMVIVTR